mmetsp:Transcript_8175/g.14793  ORF Transcript_8175/g.14793 Transcript_8175/m.14793 type:complete len:93 (+) Transcript_8175:99-377(+)|eukprot:CAMPEP_0201627700 /NCGR_PEP_ID=MMETSP0493-20130528/2832_1 /ASSEMBLY_ACC=CAM_ASM_000838 /TAXON_ID=420259 /ORGANISM="Thalassiosira gravida, Strain GMp14c1" /LENGTH=92 /DNA_ID=CAMNT_0048098239 /DNA_START=21 /DNA_END=299 /DNA_ORIENTATION=+
MAKHWCTPTILCCVVLSYWATGANGLVNTNTQASSTTNRRCQAANNNAQMQLRQWSPRLPPSKSQRLRWELRMASSDSRAREEEIRRKVGHS